MPFRRRSKPTHAPLDSPDAQERLHALMGAYRALERQVAEIHAGQMESGKLAAAVTKLRPRLDSLERQLETLHTDQLTHMQQIGERIRSLTNAASARGSRRPQSSEEAEIGRQVIAALQTPEGRQQMVEQILAQGGTEVAETAKLG